MSTALLTIRSSYS